MLRIIIPARGGSKGIPNKNITLVAGKPLIKYSLEAALQIKEFLDHQCQIILTSDSDNILAEGSKNPSITLHKRSQELSHDSALTKDVIKQIIFDYNFEDSDAILLLQPTVPLRPKGELFEVLHLLKSLGKNYSSLVSLIEVDGYHPFRMKRVVGNNLCISYIDQGFEDMRPRQSLPKCYIRSGSYYASSALDIVKMDSLVSDPCYGYIHKDIKPINIDQPQDIKLAELQLNEFNEQ